MKKLKNAMILLLLIPFGYGFKVSYKNADTVGPISQSNELNITANRAPQQINNPNKKIKHNVSQIIHSEWNNASGLPYKQVVGANLGSTSFALLGNGKTAFLSDATSEIIIINNSDGKVSGKFSVAFAPRDFIYDPPYFYVLSGHDLTKYSEVGKEIKRYLLANSQIGVERIARFKNATYLLLPTGNSLKIEQSGNAVEPSEHKGWITSSGIYVKTRLNGSNSYSVNVITPTGNIEKDFFSDTKVAGVFVVGANASRVVLDIQLYISENPISIERRIVSIERNKNGLGEIIADTKIPDCYYVLSNKDFCLGQDGRIYNMLTAPTGMFIFSLNEASSTISKDYPTALSTIKYHFNNHLLKVGN